MASSSYPAVSRHRNKSVSSAGKSSRLGKMVSEAKDFTSPTSLPRYFEPCAATASMFVFAQGASIVVCNHDKLNIARRFSRHTAEISLLAVDTQSELGAGRLVVSYDVDMTAIVWDLMTGDEVARFASYETLTCAAWMRNGNVAFGNTQGSIILFEPNTSEHISFRTIDQICVTALAPASDCRTFAIGYQNGSLLVVTLQPRFTILHNLNTNRGPSPVINLAWHASSTRQKSDMLAVQLHDGDLRVWSVPKSVKNGEDAKVVRILKRTEQYQDGPNWMGWSKNGRIVQFSEGQTLSWDVRTKHVTHDSIPTLDHVRGLAVYGPTANLFTIGANSTIQQFDLNTPSMMTANVQHLPDRNLLPPSPPVSIEEQSEQGLVMIATGSETESMPSILIRSEVSESDEDHMSPFARIARQADMDAEAYEQDRYRARSPGTDRSQTYSAASKSSKTSGTRKNYANSSNSRMTENTYISAGSSMKSSVRRPYGDTDAYSLSSVSSTSMTSSSRPSRSRPSQLRNQVDPNPEDNNRVHDLFQFTRSRLHDMPYKRTPLMDQIRLTNDDLRRQMLSVVFGWSEEAEDLIRDEASRHPAGSPNRILLSKWLGDVDVDIMTVSAANMTSSDWMLLALSGIGGHASQHKVGQAYVQRLLETGDIHAAAAILIGMGDHNDAIEIYVSHKHFMEALLLLCIFFPKVWDRQKQITKKWGEFAVQHGQEQLAIRCFSCCSAEPSEPWSSPSATQVTFQSMNQTNTNIADVMNMPLSPAGINRGPQRSITQNSSLKVITSFGDRTGKSKFFSGDDGQTPIAGGNTAIPLTAIENNNEPATAIQKPSSQRTFGNPPPANATPNAFGRSRLPSIGESNGEAFVPPKRQPSRTSSRNENSHSRQSSVDERAYLQAGLSLPRASTASPMMMKKPMTAMESMVARDVSASKDLPLPSPSPESFAALMDKSGRSIENGTRARAPSGLELTLEPMGKPQDNNRDTSPQRSATSSVRFHWPRRRRGPASVASSITSTSSIGVRSAKSGRGNAMRSANDYIHVMEVAQKPKKPRSRSPSQGRQEAGHQGSLASVSRPGDVLEITDDRGRSSSRSWTPQPSGKRSPTSPVPMSPEDLANLRTPKVGTNLPRDNSVVSMRLDDMGQSTARKQSQIRVASRTSSRASRAKSKERRLPALDTRPSSKSRGDSSTLKSPSSPVPMSATQGHNHGSDNEEDYRAALEDQESFRNRHNRSRGVRELQSPAISTQGPLSAKPRDRSQSRRRKNKTPMEQEDRPRAASTQPIEPEHERTGDLRVINSQRQAKKEHAARELEERRKSLAQRPLVPLIPRPQDDASPVSVDAHQFYELPSTTFSTPREYPERSKTADFTRSNMPRVGLPATPKAMRLTMESQHEPSMPNLSSKSFRQTPSISGRSSPGKNDKLSAQQPAAGLEQLPSLTLLPSTVYAPPARPNIPRCMSAPIPDDPPIRSARKSSFSTRKMSLADAQGNSGYHSRNASRDAAIPPPPPPPSSSMKQQPLVMELQHLASPPPPPPPPLQGQALKSTVYGSGNGTIEIVMDEDEKDDIPTAAPMGSSAVPIISPPAPPSSRSSHTRGRSMTEKDAGIMGRWNRTTERMRSASRGPSRNESTTSTGQRTISPPISMPYESVQQQQQQQAVLSPMTYKPPQQLPSQHVERHPREVRAAYQLQQQQQQQVATGTGLRQDEMF